MNERPGLGIKDRGAILLIVIRRFVIYLQKGIDGDELAHLEQVQMVRVRLAQIDFLL